MLLADLLEELPEELARQVFTHASWSQSAAAAPTRAWRFSATACSRWR